MAGLELVIVLLLILLNGVLAMSELAMVSARPSRLQQRAESGDKGAEKALLLASDPSRFLSTVQIGITAIGIITGVFGGAALAEPLSNLLSIVPALDPYSGSVSLTIVVIGITYLSLIIGELVPKQLALKDPETVASLVAGPMTFLSRIGAPAVAFLAVSSQFVLRLIGSKPSDEPSVTSEEVELLLRQGAEAGIFHESERSMVEGVFDIGNRSASELMTPRHRIVFLDLSESEEENAHRMSTSPHNFYPVCEGTTDHVVGMISVRELWRRQTSGESTEVRDAMQPALFVPEIASIISVIDQLRHERSKVALVIDEYGGVEGLITLNDVFSDVVGELDDPHRTNVKGGVRREDGSWLLDGDFPAHEVRELFAIESLPGEDEGRYETVGGLVMDQLGRIPRTAEFVALAGHRFEVVDMDGNRIDKVLVTRHPEMDGPTVEDAS